MISGIIPTFEAGATIDATLAGLLSDGATVLREVIVADGGSTDDTVARALRSGCRAFECERGRGEQLTRGAAKASGEWLLFLHADTCLAPGWATEARAFALCEGNVDRAATFTLALDDPAPTARLVERIVALRVRLLALPYGDQGLLISRSLYDTVGGFRPLPLMEDVDLARRIGRRRLATLRTKATTSAERYRREGYPRRIIRNACCLALYYSGVKPARIAGLYG